MSRRMFTFVVLLVLAAGLVGGVVSRWLFPAAPVDAQSRSVTAQDFRVVDESGNVRAVLALRSSGQVGLGLWDDNNRLRAVLDYSPDTGTTSLTLGDANERPRAIFGLARNGAPILDFGDQAETARLSLDLSDEEAPRLIMRDASGRVRIGMGVFADGPDLSFFDEQRQRIWGSPAQPAGTQPSPVQSGSAAPAAASADAADYAYAPTLPFTHLWSELRSLIAPAP